MLVSDFDFNLPPELIAQHPLPDRAASRMLQLSRNSGEMRDDYFRNFSRLLRPSDLLVFNDTRVFPARLFGRRLRGGNAEERPGRQDGSQSIHAGKIEVLLTRQLGEFVWQALVRPGKKIGIGDRIFFHHARESAQDGSAGELSAEVIARGDFGERTLHFNPAPGLMARIERIGHIPLPPYIARKGGEQGSAGDDFQDASREDRERYQTVYARETGSVAAPTAGLHFTPEVIAEIRDRGIETAEVTLHVGLGTFQPVRHEVVEENKLHLERYSISTEAAGKINRAKRDGRRVVAVGTTTVRTLEFAALSAARSAAKSAMAESRDWIQPGSGDADIFIYPGFEFRVIDALLTNFHLPRSTLLMLVCAFAGRDNVLTAYRHAVARGYRFFSYGDCMFVE